MVERTKEPIDEGEKESEKRRVKAGLETGLIKTKIMAFIQPHHLYGKQKGQEAVTDLSSQVA